MLQSFASTFIENDSFMFTYKLVCLTSPFGIMLQVYIKVYINANTYSATIFHYYRTPIVNYNCK